MIRLPSCRRYGPLLLLGALGAATSACGADEPEAGGTGGGTGTSSHTGGAGGVAISGNILQVDGGRYHTCLRTRSGAVYCWGQGAYGALGNDGSYRGVPTRTLVVDDAVDIRCGGRFSCARRLSGSLFCWGEDQAGQLGGPHTTECGDAQIDSVCAPVPQIVDGIQDAAGLALGRNHSCALLDDATVRCWGSNAEGQLGNSDLQDQQTPVAVAGVQGAVQVAAGDAHTCALVGSPGQVVCWGANANGQVGAGAVTDREPSPVEVAGITDAVEVAAGGEHTCARRADRTVVCWGYNYFGQIGKDSKQPTRVTSPEAVVAVGDAVQLALGRYHTCARHVQGQVSCWGYNSKGQLGDGTSEERPRAVSVVSMQEAAFIAAGSWHTCAIMASGPVLCWGDNLGGQLGVDGVNDTPNPTPVPVVQLPTD